jgi:hypothetical protein
MTGVTTLGTGDCRSHRGPAVGCTIECPRTEVDTALSVGPDTDYAGSRHAATRTPALAAAPEPVLPGDGRVLRWTPTASLWAHGQRPRSHSGF